ncbi:methylmalonyl-CoA/ethylmalonyl-CoA epimerase [Nonomuraea maritima]|jgi:methylmalonyl-CoA/ethylmalonyl-CoA epimerase|uniref:Methylmalonyl-CoA/ethylmalonyl-CoA epimerase n=1 Tax=Nonomuraea maritima TaxID=683260 RepID=A0A1G8ZHM6_9ACTN|nr:methylmalonyl-CoA epimerase [Nonomuraea maritima]SDK13650.1 methylmalonyl-CoA/ethylmalonyl-CoA epimerase [Nonomuraea maritima]
MFMRIDHIGIACRDLEEKIELFSRTFELTVVAREVNEEQGVKEAMLHIADGEGGGSYIQLLEPLSDDSPVGKFLARRGEGVHHVAFGVPDVADAMRKVQEKGVRLLDERPRHGSMGSEIAFIHPKDVGGMLTELVQAATPSQNAKNVHM